MTSPSAGDQTAGAVPVAAPVRTMGRSSVDASRSSTIRSTLPSPDFTVARTTRP